MFQEYLRIKFLSLAVPIPIILFVPLLYSGCNDCYFNKGPCISDAMYCVKLIISLINGLMDCLCIRKFKLSPRCS